MHDSYFMEVLYSWDELEEHAWGLGFLDAFASDDIVEQFSLLHELHHQEELLGSLDDLVQLDNIGVPNQF